MRRSRWRDLAMAAVLAFLVEAVQSNDSSLFDCPKGQWELEGIYCYQFFDIRHSWQKASELCKRYGSNLVTVESYNQNNFTAKLAEKPLRGRAGDSASYWLGYQTQNNLQTNTLAAAPGNQISQYYGHWALEQPRIEDGQCVKSVLRNEKQEWELTRCETLLPFMCQIKACPRGSKHCSNGNCVNEAYVCDGQDDCGDGSDELNCEEMCTKHMNQLNSGQVESPGRANGMPILILTSCLYP